jgi:hypothetical protein
LDTCPIGYQIECPILFESFEANTNSTILEKKDIRRQSKSYLTGEINWNFRKLRSANCPIIFLYYWIWTIWIWTCVQLSNCPIVQLSNWVSNVQLYQTKSNDWSRIIWFISTYIVINFLFLRKAGSYWFNIGVQVW